MSANRAGLRRRCRDLCVLGVILLGVLASGRARADDPERADPEREDPATTARRLALRSDSVYLSLFQIYQPSLTSREAQLPRHVRASYRLTPRLEATLGLEVHGDTWLVQGMRERLDTRRDGGSAFAELGVAAAGSVRVDLRLGISVDRYTLPDTMTDTTHDGSLGVAAFAQLLAVLGR